MSDFFSDSLLCVCGIAAVVGNRRLLSVNTYSPFFVLRAGRRFCIVCFCCCKTKKMAVKNEFLQPLIFLFSRYLRRFFNTFRRPER